MTTWALTGATGFIGRHLARQLIEDGDQVRALVRPGSEGAGLPDGVLRLVVALDDEAGLEAALEDVEVVAHLAAPRRRVVDVDGRPTRAARRPGGRATLVGASRRLAVVAGRVGARRLVITSSTAVYGRPWSRVVEESPVRPRSSYARDRLEGEQVTREAAAAAGVELTVARLSEIFGPGGTSHVALVRALLAGGFRVVGSGRQLHQIGYVRDTARALAACGRVREAAGRTYLVSGPEWSFRKVVESLGRAAGQTVAFTPALDRPARMVARTLARWPPLKGTGLAGTLDYHLRPRSYDLTRSLSDLGPYHRTALDTAAEAVVDWYRTLL